jgi:cytochrome c oxidase subunit II
MGAFLASLLASFAIFGVKLPTPVARIDPQNMSETEFAQPAIRNVGLSHYEIYIVAQMWNYNAGPEAGAEGAPHTIHIPTGSQVTFYVTSRDVIHGFYVERHSVNLEVIPGQVARGTASFNHSGTFKIVCDQYCGAGHQGMYATIIVE